MFRTLRERLAGIQEEAEEAAKEAAEETAKDGGDASAEQAQEPTTDRASGGGLSISERKLDDILFDLEIALYEADVAESVVQDILEMTRTRLTGPDTPSGVGAREAVQEALRAAIVEVLDVGGLDFDAAVAEADKPFVVMFVGVNGTGKTTAIARIAHRLKGEGYSSVMAAGDTFRAGAIEQLEKHASHLGVRMIKHQAGSDPAAVAYDAVEHARARSKDVVLIDTAGRMQTNVNLMDQMKKIQRIAEPDMTVFVGDALAGNDAIDQARTFDAAVGVDGVILTKIDSDAKGGAALSIAHAVGKPILFLGVGQDYADLIPFRPQWMVERLFGP